MNSSLSWKKFWFCFYPILIYMVVQQVLISLVMPVVIAVKYRIGGGDVADWAQLTTFSQEYFLGKAVLYTTVGAVITLIPAIICFVSDRKKNRVIIEKRSVNAWKYILIVVGAICTSLGLSFIITIFSLGQKVDSFNTVNQTLFSGNLMIQLIGIGLIVPIAEEFIFRGLVYNRMKTVMGSAMSAMLITSVLFGVFHQNIVQAVCAFAASLFICLVYEKFADFKAPVLFHICFNLPSVILTAINFKIDSYYTMVYWAVGFTVVAAVIAYIIMRIIPEPLYRAERTEG